VAAWTQGEVLLAGRGRVADFGDGSILVSPGMAASLGRWGSYTANGDAADFAQNPRLLRSVLDWLAGRAGSG
jgi:hypothetical protein